MTSPSGPRRLPLRFSLRVLLVAVTSFAIGFPIWYRWPYEEEEISYAKNAAGQPDYSRPPTTRRVITWQRQWGRGLEKHGEERYYLGGKLMEITTYRNDKRHGPLKKFHPEGGNDRLSGQFKFGNKDGIWRYYAEGGQEVTRLEYRQGQLMRIDSGGGNRTRRLIEFSDAADVSRITINGIAVENRLAQLVRKDAIDNRRLKEQLQKPTVVEFVETPLKDAIDFLATQHEIPLLIDPHHVDPEQPITEELHGVPLTVALTVVATSHGLGCDCRYGLLWITSADDAMNWHDPTGVADLVLPTDSQLARSWNEPVQVQAIEQPLADVIDGMVGRLAIAVDTEQIKASQESQPAAAVTAAFRGMPFQHVLGILLYQSRCRCLLEGETLVILPPEESP